MNARLESGLSQKQEGPELGQDPIHEDYQKADKTTENQLIQDALQNPEQPGRFSAINTEFQEVENKKYEDRVKIAEIHEEIANAEKKFKQQQISDPVEQMRVALARMKAEKKQVQSQQIPKIAHEETPSVSIENEKITHLKQQRDRIVSLMEKAQTEKDTDQYDILEDQLIEIDKLIKLESNNDSVAHVPDSSPASFNIEQDSQEISQSQVEIAEPQKQYEPTEETIAKLHEFGIDYEELLKVVPNFASLSEGQQAYVLVKAEEQSLEHIQDKANADFEIKQKESGFFKKLFRGGAMKREANRNAVNQHKGLNAFSEDIKKITDFTIESGFDISLQDNGKERNYVIEYATKPEGLTEKQEFFVDTYNKYATALSEIPYEWSLKTATKDQRKAYSKALEEFHQSEKGLQGMLEKGGLEHADILQNTFGLRAKVELNQLMSNGSLVEDGKKKGAASEFAAMKTATWQSDLTKKILQPASIGVAVGSGTRFLSKALYGLGGAAGASAIIGGIMSVRRKNQEFKQDSKDARRGKDLKKTTDTVFDAKQNAERIGKLLAKIANETDPLRRERSLKALEDRLQILDQKMKEGRVNFGKSKQQLENKSLLVEAMVESQKIRYAIETENKEVDTRKIDYVNRKDRITQQERNKERVKSALVGASVGAGAAVASWLIMDWFKGDTAANTIKTAIDGLSTQPGDGVPPVSSINIPPSVESIPPTDTLVDSSFPGSPVSSVEVSTNPTDFEVSVDASSKGAIETYADLQREILKKYPDPTQAPQHIQEFLAKSPTSLAMEDNMYRPGEVNESAKIYKGGKLGFNKAGKLVYTDARNGVDVLSGEGKFDGDHFDFKSYQEGKVSPQEFSKPTTAGQENSNDFWNTKTTNTPAPEVVASTATPEGGVMQISKDISMKVDFVEKNGRMESVITANLDKFNAYHDAYLKKDIDAYARFLVTETKFGEINGLTQEQTKERLHEYVNQMIARDQILQEGKLDPSSVQYKTIQQERDILKSVIQKQFVADYSNESFFEESTGKKYPDPNYTFENSQSPAEDINSTSQEEVKQPEVVETKTESEINKVRARNNIINQEFDFKFETDAQGRTTGYIENYKPANIPQNYFEERLGFDPEWRKTSGLPQTFEDTGEGRKISINIEKAKIALVGYDSFAPGTKEHEFFKNILIKTIDNLEKDYPAIFEYKK